MLFTSTFLDETPVILGNDEHLIANLPTIAEVIADLLREIGRVDLDGQELRAFVELVYQNFLQRE